MSTMMTSTVNRVARAGRGECKFSVEAAQHRRFCLFDYATPKQSAKQQAFPEGAPMAERSLNSAGVWSYRKSGLDAIRSRKGYVTPDVRVKSGNRLPAPTGTLRRNPAKTDGVAQVCLRSPSAGPGRGNQFLSRPSYQRPQCSTGTIQSRPFPARTGKVMESAGPLLTRGDWAAATRAGSLPVTGLPVFSSLTLNRKLYGYIQTLPS